jgi:hypothetical protein
MRREKSPLHGELKNKHTRRTQTNTGWRVQQATKGGSGPNSRRLSAHMHAHANTIHTVSCCLTCTVRCSIVVTSSSCRVLAFGGTLSLCPLLVALVDRLAILAPVENLAAAVTCRASSCSGRSVCSHLRCITLETAVLKVAEPTAVNNDRRELDGGLRASSAVDVELDTERCGVESDGMSPARLVNVRRNGRPLALRSRSTWKALHRGGVACWGHKPRLGRRAGSTGEYNIFGLKRGHEEAIVSAREARDMGEGGIWNML